MGGTDRRLRAIPLPHLITTGTMRFVRPSDAAAMKRLVEALEGAEPTYDDVGATLAGKKPEGFHHDT
jgi:hypothetical protein